MQNKRVDNRGAAIVTVLVVVTFITVLGTTMLYIAGQNYQQKQTDYQNKCSFYGAEEALDSLKALLVLDAANAYKAAYEDTSANFIKLSSKENRIDNYEQKYTDYLKTQWEDRCGFDASDDDNKKDEKRLKAVRDYMTDNGISDEVANCIYSVDDYTIATDSTDGALNEFVIKGIRAKYTSGSYTTFLYTDIAITIPPYEVTVVENSTTTELESAEKRIVAFTDYIVYMNWRKADYEEKIITY
jgi:hypothetical protein